MTHTPKPWIAAAKPSSIVGWPVVASNGRAICTMNYVQHSKIDPAVEGDRRFNAESKANAALIAEAPEMLDLLEEAADVFDGLNDDEINVELLPRLRACIAKARAA